MLVALKISLQTETFPLCSQFLTLPLTRAAARVKALVTLLPECSMDICVGVVILTESIPRSRMMNVKLCVRETRHKNAVDFGEVLFSPLVGHTILSDI